MTATPANPEVENLATDIGNLSVSGRGTAPISTTLLRRS